MSEDSDPIHPEVGVPEIQTAADGTLGGYLSHHSRPPAFEGDDGHPYTVSVEVEKMPDLASPFSGSLVFPRWADTGAGIVGHLETPLLYKKVKGSERKSKVAEMLDRFNIVAKKDLFPNQLFRFIAE